MFGTGTTALAASANLPAAISSGEAWERAADIARMPSIVKHTRCVQLDNVRVNGAVVRALA